MVRLPLVVRKALLAIGKSRYTSIARILLMPFSPRLAGFGIGQPATRWLGTRPPSNLKLALAAAGVWSAVASLMIKAAFEGAQLQLPAHVSVDELETVQRHWLMIGSAGCTVGIFICIAVLSAVRSAFHQSMAWLAHRHGEAVTGVPLSYIVAGSASFFTWLAIAFAAMIKLLIVSGRFSIDRIIAFERSQPLAAVAFMVVLGIAFRYTEYQHRTQMRRAYGQWIKVVAFVQIGIFLISAFVLMRTRL